MAVYEKSDNAGKVNIIGICLGSLIGLALLFILLFLLAALINADIIPVEFTLIAEFCTAFIALSVSAFISAVIYKRRRLVYGLLSGFVMLGIMLLLGTSISGTELCLSTLLILLAVACASGAVGSIISGFAVKDR